MIHEEICTYEVCKLAKDKGFDVPTARNYRHVRGETCNAPTQSLLQRWLREEKRIEVNAFWDNCDDMWLGFVQEMDAPDLVGFFPLNKPFPTYELALEDALKYVLENLI